MLYHLESVSAHVYTSSVGNGSTWPVTNWAPESRQPPISSVGSTQPVLYVRTYPEKLLLGEHHVICS